MVSTQHKPVWQHLRQEDGGTVVIHTKEGDTFALPIDEVIRACQSSEKVNQFCQQVATLLEKLARWLADRESEVETAYLSLEPDGAIFVVVRKGKAFDPDFEDALSSLDIEIAQSEDFGLIRLRVLALPYSSESTIGSFFQMSRSFRYVGSRAE